MLFRYLCLEIRQLRQYKTDFLIGAIPHLLAQLANIFFFRFVLDVVTEIKGWTYHQLLFIYGFSLLVFGLFFLFFGNFRNLKAMLFRGEFEIMRLRPLSVIHHIMVSSFQSESLEQILTGIAVLGISIHYLRIAVTIPMLLALLFFAACGTIALGGLAIISSAILLFTGGTFSPLASIISLSDFTKYPLTIFDEAVIAIFTWIIPIGLVSYYPSIYFLKASNTLLYSGLISIAFLLLGIFLFRCALRKYQGISS